MAETNITYETLFEILRREKTRNELQKLDSTFYQEVVAYLQEKQKLLEEKKHLQDLFAAEEKKKTEIQVENTIRIIKDLFEKREKKLIEIALDKVKSPDSAIDTSTMLKSEKDMYHNLLSELGNSRKKVLLRVLQGQMPSFIAESPMVDETPSESPNVEEKASPVQEPKPEVQESKPVVSQTMIVKFNHAIPKFLGRDLKEYGPFLEGDKAELPCEIAEIIIDKGRAEKTESL